MFRSGLLVASVLFTAGVAHAEPQYGVGLYTGVDNLTQYNKLGSSFMAERYSDYAPVFGLRLAAMNLSDSLRDGHTGLAYGLEAELGMQPSWTTDSTSAFAPVYNYRGHATVRYGNRYQLIAVAGIGGETITSSAKFVHTSTDPQFYWGLAFAMDVSANTELRFDGRFGYMPAIDDKWVDTFEAQISIAHYFGAKKTFPGPGLTETASAGDMTATTTGSTTTASSTGTVTHTKADVDTDGDGFPDSVDKCPNEPETVNGYADDDGCPEPDGDGDKIIDALDKCPTQPEDKDGFQDEDGCPDPDNDGDGVPDAQDKCPNEPETKNGYMDSDGCPDQVPDAIGKAHPAMKFAKGRGKLAADDEAALKPVIDVMVAAADLRIAVVAHPDSKSRAAAALAQLRADTVRSYMTAHGVTDGSRIEAKVGDVAAKGPAIEIQIATGAKAGGAF